MIQEAYVTYETAKLLKEKGFDVPCCQYYAHYDDVVRTVDSPANWNEAVEGFSISAPTQQMAMAWLRELHNIHIEMIACASGYKFIISKAGGDGTDLYYSEDTGPNFGGNWDIYEQAVEAALKYSLKNLILS